MRKSLALALALILLPLTALAQRSTATIRGTVTDPSGAVVAGAKVAVKNEASGAARSGTSNSSGVFVFADLAVGTY